MSTSIFSISNLFRKVNDIVGTTGSRTRVECSLNSIGYKQKPPSKIVYDNNIKTQIKQFCTGSP